MKKTLNDVLYFICKLAFATFLFVCLSLLLSGCTVYGGVAMHSESWDAPEVSLENPIGIVGGELETTDNIKLFIEHHSGITDLEHGYGYNLIGVKYEYKLF